MGRRGGGPQNKEGAAEEVEIENGEQRKDGAFVHLNAKREEATG